MSTTLAHCTRVRRQAHGPCQKLSPSRVSRERVTQRLRVDGHCDAPEILTIMCPPEEESRLPGGVSLVIARGKADVADTPCPCQTGQASLRSSRVIPVQCMWNYSSKVQSIFHFFCDWKALHVRKRGLVAELVQLQQLRDLFLSVTWVCL